MTDVISMNNQFFFFPEQLFFSPDQNIIFALIKESYSLDQSDSLKVDSHEETKDKKVSEDVVSANTSHLAKSTTTSHIARKRALR